ncbi:MAG: CHAD domain-containing protein, partial [Planctomycetota bacterium]
AEQQAVNEACADAEALQFPEQIDRLLDKVRWRGSSSEPTLLKYDAKLFDAATRYFFANIHPESKDPHVLHETRIEAKRLRYTLELVEPVLPKTVARKPRRLFAELQESLGQISDHAAAEELFNRWADDSSAGSTLRKLAATERKQMNEAAVAFHTTWPAQRLDRLKQLLKELVAAVQTAAE